MNEGNVAVQAKCVPWRRYFARNLDMMIYNVLLNCILALGFNINLLTRGRGSIFLEGFIILAMMLFIEPALISAFGTTIGKWILGMRVTYNDGEKLSYIDALDRTFTVIYSGMGLNIPIYAIVRLWKSHTICDAGEELPWEKNYVLSLKDEKSWRIAAYFGTIVAMVVVIFCTQTIALAPKNRGDITVAEFCENVNKLAKYESNNIYERIRENGTWGALGEQKYFDYGPPTFIFETEAGKMTGMHFTSEAKGQKFSAQSYIRLIQLAILSFVRAQKDCPIFFEKELRGTLKAIEEAQFKDYEFEVYGVKIKCDVEYSGYIEPPVWGAMFPNPDGKSEYKMSFEMRK